MRKTHSLKSNAVLNIIRQCCHMVFPLITYPYVLRVLGAANLGKYSFSDSIIAIAMIFASLGINNYAIREGSRIRDDKEKITTFCSEIFSINIISMAVAHVVLFVLLFTVPRLHRDVLVTYILSFNIIANVLGREWINNIYEDFLYITLRYCVFQIISIVLIFALVKEPGDYIKYTIIMMFSTAGSYLANLFFTMRYVPLRFTFTLNYKKHLKPIILLFCVSLAVQIYVKSDITILGFFRSDSEIGIYTAVSKIYMIVKTILNAVIAVFLPRFSYYLGQDDKASYLKQLDKLRRVLYVLIFPAMTGLFCVSGAVLRLLGGDEYISGTSALRILCVALGFAVLGCYYSNGILLPNRKDKYFFYATLASAIVNIGLNFFAVPFLGIEGAALTTLLAEAIVVIILKKYSSEIYKATSYKELISILIGCAVIVIMCRIVNYLHCHYVAELILSVFLSVPAYIVVMVLLKNPVVMDGFRQARSMLRKL